MTDRIVADAAALRATQAGFDGLARSVADVLTRLDATLAAEGPCWGHDETGVAFADQYRPTAAAIRAVLLSTSSDVGVFGDAVAAVARWFAAADAAAGDPWSDG